MPTCTMGQEGSWTWSSRFAARAPLRKVGPRLIVMLANLNIKMIKMLTMKYVFNKYVFLRTFSPYHENPKADTLTAIPGVTDIIVM